MQLTVTNDGTTSVTLTYNNMSALLSSSDNDVIMNGKDFCVDGTILRILNPSRPLRLSPVGECANYIVFCAGGSVNFSNEALIKSLYASRNSRWCILGKRNG